MSYITIVVLIFSVLGALDRIFGNRFGIGKEFEKGFTLLGIMALSMIGMIVIAPAFAQIIKPVSGFVSNVLHIDPSIIPVSLFANDMGGAPLAVEMAENETIGKFNAMVVSSMMGCTISFTLPFALGVVSKECHKELFLGLLCGIVTIPIGCFAAGLLCGIPLLDLILNLIPLVIFSGVIAAGLMLVPDLCIKIFRVFGVIITIVITIGLALGVIRFLTGAVLLPGMATIEEGMSICMNAAIVLSGAFPFMYIVSKLLQKPLRKVGTLIGIDEMSVLGMLATLVTVATSFGTMDKMNKKGVVLNAALSVSAAFVFGSHLAFTMAFEKTYVYPVLAGKLIAGVLAVILASVLYGKLYKENN